jgi:hypothetical protein
MWTAVYPTDFQPYRENHANIDNWVLAGCDREYATSYMPRSKSPLRGERRPCPQQSLAISDRHFDPRSRSRCDVSDTPPAKLCQKSSNCGQSVGQGLQNCGRTVVGSDVGKSRASRCDYHSLIPAEMRSQQPRQI